MEQDDDVDTVSLLTRGTFVRRNNSFFIRYAETEATGYKGSFTTVKVEDSGRVSMMRTGPARSTLIIEPGRRHVCHYDSGHGVINLGVAADTIHNQLTERGGDITFSYTLDSGFEQLSRNEVKITVQEVN